MPLVISVQSTCCLPLQTIYRGLPQSRAKAIAEGRLDPITMEAFNSVPSPKTPGLAFGEKKEFKKNLDSTPSPITPFSMYSSKKGSPNFSQLSNSRQGSKPAIFPATAFSMFGSKRKTLNIFDSPPLQASESDGRIEPDSEVTIQHYENASPPSKLLKFV